MLSGFMNSAVLIADCVRSTIPRHVLLMPIRGCDVVLCGEPAGASITEPVRPLIRRASSAASLTALYYGAKWGVSMGRLGDGGIEVFVGIIFVCR